MVVGDFGAWDLICLGEKDRAASFGGRVFSFRKFLIYSDRIALYDYKIRWY